MNRREAVVALLSSPFIGAWLWFLGRNGDWSFSLPERPHDADPDVPFSGILDNGDRIVESGEAEFEYRITAIRDARTGEEIDAVRLNWDGPWLDRYADPGFGVHDDVLNDKIIRDHRAFTLELDGRVYRSASL